MGGVTGDPLAHRAQAVALRALAAGIRPLDDTTAAHVGAALGLALRAVMPKRRRIVADNLRRAYGADGAAASRARETFAHGGRLLVECLLLAERTPRLRDLVALDGLAHLDAARAVGRGVLLFTGHLGNWELIGPRLVAEGYPTAVLVGAQRNRRVDRWLNAARRAGGQGTIPLRGGGREALTRLRRGEIVGVLVDQRLRRGGVLVPFFGHHAATSPAAARIALSSGAAVVPVSIVRHADGVHHTATFEPALVFESTADRDRDALRLTRAMTAAVEAQIRRAPAQYYWFHQRWKPPSDVPRLVWDGD